MNQTHIDLVRRSYSADRAHQHVIDISQYHRIQASPGYRAAAGCVLDQLTAAGVKAQIRRYPADGAFRFWSSPSFLEWDCTQASLHLLGENGHPVELLCDFDGVPISLIQRSIPVDGEYELVALGGKGGGEAADYEGVDVRGKILLTEAPAGRVLALAVRERGAAGLLFYGMAAGGRTALDLPNARQYTSFWYHGAEKPDGWGFVISPRRGQTLRARLAGGELVRVRAHVASRFYPGRIEAVEGLIPGTTGETGQEILLVAHLCHPRPGAHDNGSGAAALIEAAATVARLIAAGDLPQPARGIRLIWPPEMTGTYAWLAEHEADVRRGRWIAGLNLDMVGADQNLTGSTWELTRLPEAGAAFADHLLSWLRTPFLAGQRHAETPFTAGSDHYILSDPSVGIPTPMLGQWPDLFYHTSDDTPDKVSADSLGRSGALTAAYAYWLASAGLPEARWLGHWMVSRYAAGAGEAAVQAVATAMAAATAAASPAPDPATAQALQAKHWARYQRQSAFQAARMYAALDTLICLAPKTPDGMVTNLAEEIASLKADVAGHCAREQAWVRAQLPPDLLPEPAIEEADWLQESKALAPQRRFPGPIDVGGVIRQHDMPLQEVFWAMSQENDGQLSDVAPLLQYWADGRRSIAEIAELVKLETGVSVGDLPLRYFKLLAEINMVIL